MDLNREIDRLAEDISEDLVRIRRTIHANPEMAFEEFETAALVAETLERIGVACRTGVGGTGVVGIIEGGEPGRTLAIRADMDCLPVHEETGLPFASKVPGKMHACGHDVHTTILLGVAMVIDALSERLKGRIKLVFQPSEEGLSGAQAMIDDGVLEDPSLDLCLGFHNLPTMEAGKVGYCPDIAFASSDEFDIVIKGRSGHAAFPHLAVDTVTAAGHFITQLQSIVSREVPPLHAAVISIGRIHGGTARNILPDAITIMGTVRTRNEDTRKTIEASIRRQLDGLRTGLRIDYDLDYRNVVPVMRNDKRVLESVVASAGNVLGSDNVIEILEGTMGSEDFSLFTERMPGAHLRIGGQIEGRELVLHRSDFDCNELAIPTGVRAISRAAFDLLS